MSEENQIIEEMALAICKSRLVADDGDVCRTCKMHETCLYEDIAYGLYNAGYRKQSEGEWKLGKSGCMYCCSCCGYAAHPREVDEWTHCPKCGAKMKGAD